MSQTPLAVVSLAIQLGGTVNQIRKFLRNVQNAPVELSRLISLLDHLHINLAQARCLADQQTSVLGDLGSVMSVANAVQNCNELVKPIEILMQELQRSASQRKPLHKVLSAMKVARKKEDITQLENQLRGAVMTLQTAIMINSSQIQ